MKEKPQIDWGTGMLIFPNQKQWGVVDDGSNLAQTVRKVQMLVNQVQCKQYDKKQAIQLGAAKKVELQQSSETLEEEEAKPIPYWIQEVVTQHAVVFEPIQGIPPDNRIKHTIQLVKGARPVMKRPYRLSACQRA